MSWCSDITSRPKVHLEAYASAEERKIYIINTCVEMCACYLLYMRASERACVREYERRSLLHQLVFESCYFSTNRLHGRWGRSWQWGLKRLSKLVSLLDVDLLELQINISFGSDWYNSARSTRRTTILYIELFLLVRSYIIASLIVI